MSVPLLEILHLQIRIEHLTHPVVHRQIWKNHEFTSIQLEIMFQLLRKKRLCHHYFIGKYHHIMDVMDYSVVPVQLPTLYELRYLEAVYQIVNRQNYSPPNGLHVLDEHRNLVIPQLMDNYGIPLFHPVPVTARNILKLNPAHIA